MIDLYEKYLERKGLEDTYQNYIDYLDYLNEE